MINVSCAIISDNNGKILVTQRSETMKMPLKWEFPGGKIEENETAEECLQREIREELDVEITIKSKLIASVHEYDDFIVNLIPFVCEIEKGEIRLSEHSDFIWVNKSELKNLDWLEADIPIFKQLL